MGYLDEAGLAALVGKVKGQMVELTAEEYAQIDPAIKNYDNKLYFVKNAEFGYTIDNEPTANSNNLVKSGGIYNWTSKIGSGTLTTNAKTLIPAVNEVNAKIGSTDISSIGDGTLSGAVNEVNAKIGSTDISSIGDGTLSGAVNELDNGLSTVGKPVLIGTSEKNPPSSWSNFNLSEPISNFSYLIIVLKRNTMQVLTSVTLPVDDLTTSESWVAIYITANWQFTMKYAKVSDTVMKAATDERAGFDGFLKVYGVR
jgi:hypothetical protein